MRIPLSCVRAARLLSVAVAALSIAACGGGGGKTNLYSCGGQQSPGWNDQVLSFLMPGALQYCPLTLTRQLTVNAFVQVDMDAGKNGGFPPSYGLYEMWIKNTADGSGNPIAPYKQSWDYLEFNDYSPEYYSAATGDVWRANTPFEYELGFPAQSGLQERDSLFMFYQLHGGITYSSSFVASDKAGFWAKNSVVRDTTPADLLGPTIVDAGVSNNWTAYTTWDTTGYAFDWYVNGVQQPRAETATLAKSFSTAGDYVVRFDQHLIDTTYTVTKNVHVPLTVITTAPDTLDLDETGYWSASASAGTAPYSYTWSVDGNVVGNGSTLSWASSTGNTMRYVTLNVADSGGLFRTLGFAVWITDGLPCGGDPNCAAEVRASPMVQLLDRFRRRPR